jgi:His-Xaa-Ser system radical SAM maturase HxsC
MAIKLTTYGQAIGLELRAVLRVTRNRVIDVDARRDHVLVLDQRISIADINQLVGYGAVFIADNCDSDFFGGNQLPIVKMASTKEFKEGHIVTIESKSGFIRTVYRPESSNNTLFATDRCNSNCLMCSQPPKDIDDSYLIKDHLRIISLIQSPPETLGITGGEPTLLGDHLITLLQTLKHELPTTHIQMLTNGRLYKNPDFPQKLAAVGHPSFVSAIPLYGDVACVHDYVVQARGAFDETVEGIYNAAEAGLPVEIRIVLHKQTIPRLKQLAQFIAWNFPFAVHIAFMGLEHMGYVKKNWDDLWIDPVDYMLELENAVTLLHRARMNVSIYNIQLCLLAPSLWAFARQSISDYKNIFLDACHHCTLREQCCGLFLSQSNRHSDHIRPFTSSV